METPFPGCGCNDACFDRACVLRFEQKETVCGLINTPRTGQRCDQQCVVCEADWRFRKWGGTLQQDSQRCGQSACLWSSRAVHHARARDHTH
jgi:hypothetical protein